MGQATNAALWLATVGRVLAAFGLGVLAARYYPGLASRLALPAAVAGVVCLIAAGWLQRRTATSGGDAPTAP